ncbi:MAG: DUF1854 domain-containing protein [Clostridia bacterium]|nr:DUF1854 domain-containing protein [Clostridia bacterium]
MSEEKINSAVPNELRGIVDIVYLNRDNCKITEKNGFIGLRAVLDKREESLFDEEKPEKESKPDEKAENSERDGKDEKKDRPAVVTTDLGDGKVEKLAERIFLSRAFPFDMPFEYISVLDRDKKEIGLIRALDDFDEPDRSMLLHELEAKYYTPVIRRIISVKERYGFSYWKCECEFGETSFTLKDTFRSIIKASSPDGKERAFIIDVDGNRYEIPDMEALDRHSYKKIELYL